MLKKFVLLLLVFILSACNFPTRQTPRFEETLQAGLVQTAAALTAIAPFEKPVPQFVAPVVQVPVEQAPVAAPPAVQPAHSFVPVSQTGLPVVTVSVNTNCRSGPARAYSMLGWLLVGEQAVVVGHNQRLNYLVIQNPRGEGNCWLWGQYATVFGDLNTVPHVEFPFTTPGVPVTGPAYLSVSVITNCRSGPAAQYPIQGVLQPGQFAPVLGRDPTSTWWLIQHPGSIGQCWVWGGYAQISGNVAAIPVIPITAPTPPPPAPTVPFLAVSVNTNCRVGPSTQDPIVHYLLVGQYAFVLGRNFDASWWLIQNPNQPGLNCWVWGRYATLWGDFGSIPVIPPTGVTPVPPTPIPPTPVPPTPIPPVTPIPEAPFLMVSVNTACRNAPSPRFPVVGTLQVGQQAFIYGRNTLGDWWYVQLPTFPEVQCWVWGQYAAIYGDTSQVPVLPVAGLALTPEADPPQQVAPPPVAPQLDPTPIVPQQPAVPGAQPIVPNAPAVLTTPTPGQLQLPQIAPDSPFFPFFENWAPTLAPPEIIVRPVGPTPGAAIEPVLPPPAPVIVEPPPIIQPTPLPPVVQPFVVQTPVPVIPTPLPPLPVQPGGVPGAEECIVVNQTIPFGQEFAAGTPFEARWTVLNTGAAAWNPGEVNATYFAGDVLHTTAQAPLTQAVLSGGLIDISVPMVAPPVSQSYSTAWAITRGAQVLCNLVVVIEVQ
jgi:uncharacterized protein YraI